MARNDRQPRKVSRVGQTLRNHHRPSVVDMMSRQSLVETLEPRQVMAVGDPVIAEFQADNATGLVDKFGEHSDWIEVRNPSVTQKNIGGWYLTDDKNDLKKWQFPAGTTIDAGAQIIVFASSKNVVTGTELHTNFKLDAAGEYLALVAPDGKTTSTVFDPYPQQVVDQSYGIATRRDNYNLVTDATAVKVFVPTNDSLGDTWKQTGFNDAAWTSGTMGVGFENLLPGYTVSESFDAALNPAIWTTDVPAGGTGTAQVTGGSLAINVPTGQSTSGTSRGTAPIVSRPLPDPQPADYEIISHISIDAASKGNTGIAVLDAATGLPAIQLEYAAGARFQLMAGGNTIRSNTSTNRTDFFLRLVRDSTSRTWTGYFKVLEADTWTKMSKVATDGDAGVPFVAEPRVALYGSAGTSVMNANFQSLDIVVGDQKPVYGPEIGTNVGAAMSGKNASAYVRIPFTFASAPSIIDELTMKTRFDDGFRAFLNGTELTAQNVPLINETAWNSAADFEYGAVGTQIPTKIIGVSAQKGALVQGQNVLAIQMMNVAAADNDVYFDTFLTAADVLGESTQFFVTPTPGFSNELPASPTPIISGAQGAFFGSTEVSMTIPNATPNMEIRYTLDGNEPTATSNLYTGPITLTTSAMMQARVFDHSAVPAYAPGNSASATFIAFDNALHDFSSNLPIMVLDTLGAGLASAGGTSLTAMNSMIFDTSKATGRTTIDNNFVDYLGRGGARDRGSSTAGQAKPNMAFETWGKDGTNEDDDNPASLLGLPKDADWVLHAPFDFDKVLIHNQLSYELTREMGIWAPRTRVVEVYFNRNKDGVVTSADYYGIYVLTEKIEKGADRVDVADLGSSTDPNVSPNITGGYIFKIDRSDPDAPGFTAGGQSINWVYPKSPQSTSARPDQKATLEQQTWITNYLNEFRTTLNTPDINDPNGYSKYIDPADWVDNHLLNVFMMNVDALRLSAYFYKDANERIKFGPPWDFDRALESNDDRDDTPTAWRALTGDLGTDFFGNGTQQWWGNLFKDPGFWQLYVDRWQMWRSTIWTDEKLMATIDEMTQPLVEAQARTATKWSAERPRSSSGYKNNQLDGTYQGEINNIKQWVLDRAHFMDGNFAQRARLTVGGQDLSTDVAGAIVGPGTTVTLTSPPLRFFEDTVAVSGTVGVTTAKYFVPGNNDLGDTWTQTNFNDSSWSSGKLGIGFDNASTISYDNTYIATRVSPNEVVPGATNVLIRIPFQVNDVAQAKQNLLVLRMKYDDGFVAYLNGQQVLSKNLTAAVSWDMKATNHANSAAKVFEDFDISSFTNLLVQGTNVLSIRGVNANATQNDMLMIPELLSRKVLFGVNPAAKAYYTTDGSDPRDPATGLPSANAILAPADGKITVNKNMRITARNFDDSDRGKESRIVLSDWSSPIQFDLSITEQPIVISELNYNPRAATLQEVAAGFGNDDFEFIELQNTGTQAVQLLGLHFSDGVSFDFYSDNTSGITSLQPNQRALVVANKAAFEMRYGAGLPVIGQYSGSLDNTGELLKLKNAAGTTVSEVDYRDSDPWPAMADGVGATLVLNNPAQSTTKTQSKWYSWRSSTERDGTPGLASAPKSGVVINEVLARNDAPSTVKDAIELHNTTGAAIDVSGWYLSDNTDNMFVYQIPANSVIPANGYLSFTEDKFNANGNGFALSANGDNVYLVRGTKATGGNAGVAPGGTITQFIDDVSFRATQNGEALGRSPNGSGRLAPLTAATFGQANANPKVGPVIVSEIEYAPTVSAAALSAYPNIQASDLEFIEIRNASNVVQNIGNWHVRGGASFDFPVGTSLAAGESIVVLKFDPADSENINELNAFKAQYHPGNTVRLFGGYSGQLNNADDKVSLLRPDTSADPTNPPYVQMDEVLYDDLAPWPINAGGAPSYSIHRTTNTAFGNDGTSWKAATGSPGSNAIVLGGDLNNDGQVTAADINALFVQMRSASPDLKFDLNADGHVDGSDRDILVLNMIGTTFGDADLDGHFNSLDFVSVFIVGEYEDGIPLNSTWEEGDWNGDGDFDSLDFVLAFITGGYEDAAAARPAANVSPAAVGGQQAGAALRLSRPAHAVVDTDAVVVDSTSSAEIVLQRPQLDASDAQVDSVFADDEKSVAIKVAANAVDNVLSDVE